MEQTKWYELIAKLETCLRDLQDRDKERYGHIMAVLWRLCGLQGGEL